MRLHWAPQGRSPQPAHAPQAVGGSLTRCPLSPGHTGAPGWRSVKPRPRATVCCRSRCLAQGLHAHGCLAGPRAPVIGPDWRPALRVRWLCVRRGGWGNAFEGEGGGSGAGVGRAASRVGDSYGLGATGVWWLRWEGQGLHARREGLGVGGGAGGAHREKCSACGQLSWPGCHGYARYRGVARDETSVHIESIYTQGPSQPQQVLTCHLAHQPSRSLV